MNLDLDKDKFIEKLQQSNAALSQRVVLLETVVDQLVEHIESTESDTIDAEEVV